MWDTRGFNDTTGSQFTHTHVYFSSFCVHINTHSWDKTTKALTRGSQINKTFRVGLCNCLLDDFLLSMREFIHFKQQTKRKNNIRDVQENHTAHHSRLNSSVVRDVSDLRPLPMDCAPMSPMLLSVHPNTHFINT